MGTTYSIKIRSRNTDNMLHSKIKRLLTDINMKMSVFEKDSEINKINNAPANEWIELSDDMSELLKASHSVYKKTSGAFDPTIGKLVDLWGFGVNKTDRIPSQEEIDEILSYSGFNRIKFSADYKKIKKENANTYMNLSAIAKGYGVDKISEFLRKEGYKNFLVEIGGEVYAQGKRAKGEPGWNIGILDPTDTSKNLAVINLEHFAIATSGDYFNYIYLDNTVYSHTLSMKDGKPVRSNLTSVTVLGENCRDIDALATAFMVMGDKSAPTYANRNGIAALFFIKNKEGNIETIISNKAKKIIGNIENAN